MCTSYVVRSRACVTPYSVCSYLSAPLPPGKPIQLFPAALIHRPSLSFENECWGVVSQEFKLLQDNKYCVCS